MTRTSCHGRSPRVPRQGDDESRGVTDRLKYGGDGYGMRSTTSLPRAVQEWAGLNDPTPHVRIPRDDEDIAWDREDGVVDPDMTYEASVIDLNDDMGWDFTQIANAIEENL